MTADGQQTLANVPAQTEDVYSVLYHQIKSDNSELQKKKFKEETAREIDSLLEDIYERTGGNHSLSDLNTTRYFRRWIKDLVSTAESLEVGSDLSDSKTDTVEDIAENFSEDMQTCAKEAGKYVICILGKGKLTVCHSITGKKVLTTDFDVIEELLSADNIDKFAKFEWTEADEITVQHFDKWHTDSFGK